MTNAVQTKTQDAQQNFTPAPSATEIVQPKIQSPTAAQAATSDVQVEGTVSDAERAAAKKSIEATPTQSVVEARQKAQNEQWAKAVTGFVSKLADKLHHQPLQNPLDTKSAHYAQSLARSVEGLTEEHISALDETAQAKLKEGLARVHKYYGERSADGNRFPTEVPGLGAVNTSIGLPQSPVPTNLIMQTRQTAHQFKTGGQNDLAQHFEMMADGNSEHVMRGLYGARQEIQKLPEGEQRDMAKKTLSAYEGEARRYFGDTARGIAQDHAEHFEQNTRVRLETGFKHARRQLIDGIGRLPRTEKGKAAVRDYLDSMTNSFRSFQEAMGHLRTPNQEIDTAGVDRALSTGQRLLQQLEQPKALENELTGLKGALGDLQNLKALGEESQWSNLAGRIRSSLAPLVNKSNTREFRKLGLRLAELEGALAKVPAGDQYQRMASSSPDELREIQQALIEAGTTTRAQAELLLALSGQHPQVSRSIANIMEISYFAKNLGQG